MNRATIVFTLAAAALFWGVVLLGHANGFRINHTPSLPVGLWRIEQPRGPIERGDHQLLPALHAVLSPGVGEGMM